MLRERKPVGFPKPVAARLLFWLLCRFLLSCKLYITPAKSMSTEDDVISVIDGFYAAAAGGCGWTEPITALRRLLGFAAACFRVFAGDGSTIQQTLLDFGEQAGADYEAYYRAIDPCERFIRNHPHLRIAYNHLHTPDAEIDRSEYYTWKMRETGLCYSLAAVRGATR